MSSDAPYKIAMSGATGFVGSNLRQAFSGKGWETVSLGRNDFKGSAEDLARKMSGCRAVVNLAGAPVIGRWTEAYKKIMYESRVEVTKLLVGSFSFMDPMPEIFISTSAIGYYASDGTHTEDEYTRAEDFLGSLSRDWEEAALKASDRRIRTVIFRFGVVLGRNGGALKQMLTPFRLGLGGTIGDGSQPFSWVHIKDLVNAYHAVLDDRSYEGIYNLTAPHPTTNKGMTKALGKVLGRPTVFRIPRFALTLQFGEGAQILSSGQRVIPKRLLDKGFTFAFTDIEDALRDCVS